MNNLISRLISGYISFCGMYAFMIEIVLANGIKNISNYFAFLDLGISLFFLWLIPVLGKCKENNLLNLLFVILFILIWFVSFLLV